MKSKPKLHWSDYIISVMGFGLLLLHAYSVRDTLLFTAITTFVLGIARLVEARLKRDLQTPNKETPS